MRILGVVAYWSSGAVLILDFGLRIWDGKEIIRIRIVCFLNLKSEI